MKIYVIHENDEWTIHLFQRLEELNLPYESWFLEKGIVDMTAEPPHGVFYNRMSASSHTRGHRYAPELTQLVLEWLETHGRTVINGSGALRQEINKIAQYFALEKYGVKVPKTIAAVGAKEIVEAARKLDKPAYITKHNRAGKGLGVRLFKSLDELEKYVTGPDFDDSVDGITLIQEYIKPPQPYITRNEFVDGKYLYSVRVDTSEGFELCPAESCQIGDLFCPVGEDPKDQMKFKIVPAPCEDLMKKLEVFLKDSGIQIAGIEIILDEAGDIYAYDVNTNTNYNPDAEAKAEKYGMLEIAKYLGEELKKLS